MGNGIARNSHAEKLGPIPNGTAGTPVRSGSDRSLSNGMPSTVVPSGSEKCLANGIPNGHATPVQDSPFIGYIIAMHRKMVTGAYLFVGPPLRLRRILRWCYRALSFRCGRSCTSCRLRRTGPVCLACRSLCPAQCTPVRRIYMMLCGFRCPVLPAPCPLRRPATMPKTGQCSLLSRYLMYEYIIAHRIIQ